MVMQRNSLRQQPLMSYGLDSYVNNKVSDPIYYFLTVLLLDIKIKENAVTKSFYFCAK